MMALTRHFIVAALLALLFAASPALAQGKGEALPQPLPGWQVDLERIETALQQPGRDDAALVKLRAEVEEIRAQAGDYVRRVSGELTDVKSQLEKLGPAPKKEEAPESEAAAKLRAEIASKAADLDGAIRTAKVLQIRAAQLSGTVQSRRRSLFSRELFKRTQNPLSKNVWKRVARYASVEWRGLKFLIKEWWTGIGRPYTLFAFALLGAALLWLVLRLGTNSLIARYRTYSSDEPPPFLMRAASAGGVTLVRAAPPIAAGAALVLGLWALDMLPGKTESLAFALLYASSLVFALLALIKTVLAPNQPRWRILPASDREAKQLRWLAGGVAILLGLDILLTSLANILFAPITLTMAQSFVVTLAVALLLAAILLIRFRFGRAEDAPETSATRYAIRVVLSVLVAIILIAAPLGYVAFARFLTIQIVVNGSILILLYLLHISIEEFSDSLADPDRRAGRWLARKFDLQQRRHARAGILVSIILHALLILSVVPLFALQWGFDWEDVRTSMSKLLFGFEVGGWRISLGTIFIAILLFILGLVVTRFVQQWLDSRVLQRAHFETGARSAIRTGVGYLGVAIAAVIAVAYAGLDFSNVAIVAGALSVGIGFWLAEHRQQFRFRPDPARRATDQCWRLDYRR